MSLGAGLTSFSENLIIIFKIGTLHALRKITLLQL